MYIYHALIIAPSAHMIHINLNMVLYTHVEHSSTQATSAHMIHINLNMVLYTHVEHSSLYTCRAQFSIHM